MLRNTNTTLLRIQHCMSLEILPIIVTFVFVSDFIWPADILVFQYKLTIKIGQLCRTMFNIPNQEKNDRLETESPQIFQCNKDQILSMFRNNCTI